ncbi:MAG: hypothetical protein KDD54_02260 [Flavobacteriales bacterium]|nr:hypothetical protein [Flavobacteriales bacterium]
MSDRIAKIISYLFHPVFMPLLASYILLHTHTYVAFSILPKGKLVIYAILMLCTVMLPIITALVLLRNGMIETLHMETKEERRLPFLATAIYYFTAYYLLAKLPLPRIIMLLQLGATLSVILVLLINLRWKISVHMTGIGGFVGAVIGISFELGADLRTLLGVLIICAGLVASARISLKMHKPAQVYAGFLLGVLSEWLVISAMTPMIST